MKVLFYTMVGCLVGLAASHTYHLGECPPVEPMSGFEMSQFLGPWYVVQKTSTGSRCLTYNFTEAKEPGEFLIEQASEHPVLGIASVDNIYQYTGTLKVKRPETPARMTVKYPLSIAGTATFTVFMTDYKTYAGIYTCQKLPASNRRSVSILSRKSTLDKMYLDKIRARVSSFGVNPYDLSLIDHKGCPNEGLTFGIDGETFSPSSIGKAVKKVGEVIGDGVEVAAEGIHKLYDKATKEDDDE